MENGRCIRSENHCSVAFTTAVPPQGSGTWSLWRPRKGAAPPGCAACAEQARLCLRGKRTRRGSVADHLIGLLLGAEEDWPRAFETILGMTGPINDGGQE